MLDQFEDFMYTIEDLVDLLRFARDRLQLGREDVVELFELLGDVDEVIANVRHVVGHSEETLVVELPARVAAGLFDLRADFVVRLAENEMPTRLSVARNSPLSIVRA